MTYVLTETKAKSKLGYGSKKIALFKGLYIEEFLKIEYEIESIILAFFKEYPSKYLFVLGEANVKLEEVEIKIRNYNARFFFEHSLFIDPMFGFNAKLQSVKTIMQLLDGNYFNYLKKKKLFYLIEHLNELRNVIAHNATGYKKSEMIGLKKSKQFKGEKKKMVDEKTGKTITVDEFSFKPKIDTYIISKGIQRQIFFQLTAARTILSIFQKTDYHLNRGVIKKEDSEQGREVCNWLLTSHTGFGEKAGIFKLFPKG